tara:strand:+ start:491 stop:667 length:177 start_codon:yes stop_codon:yes gene_type:complete
MSKIIDFQEVLKNTMEHDSQARLLGEFHALTDVAQNIKEILDKTTERLKEIEPQLKFK